MTESSDKKKTVILDPSDLQALRALAEGQRLSETEAIRRSIRLSEKLLEWEMSGGEVFLKRGKETLKVVFL